MYYMSCTGSISKGFEDGNMTKGWCIFQVDKSLAAHIITELQNNVHQLVKLRLELNMWRVNCLIVVGKLLFYLTLDNDM